MHKIYTIFFLLLICCGLIQSQTQIQINDTLTGDPIKSKYISIGLTGGLNHIWNETNLPIIPGGSDCGFFNNGTDLGYYLGLGGEYEFLPNQLNFILRFIYDHRPITLTEMTSSYEVYDEQTYNYVPLIRKHNFDGYLDYLLIDVGISYKIPINFPLELKLTADAGHPIFGAKFENTEEIIKPEKILFPEMKRKRTVENGEMTNAGSSYGASLAIGTEFLLDNGFIIKPELSFRYALNSVLTDNEWHTNILRFGVQISRKFDIGEKQKFIRTKTIYLPDPPKPAPPIETVKPEIIQVFKSEPVKILETMVTQTYPLLNYVFFDSASAVIKSKYINTINTNNFSEDNLPKETLSIYYNLFDIIGSRMIINPKAKIKVTGVTDGEEFSNQKDRIKLAESRAASVADYIMNRWNISKDRIITEAQDFPKLPTSRDYIEGYQENRRVEITSDYPEILKPVVHSKFFEYTSTQDEIHFSFDLNKDIKLSGWNFIAFDGLIKAQGQINNQDYGLFKISFPLTIELINHIGSKIKTNSPLKAELTVIASDNSQEKKDIHINISKELNSFEVGRLNLIVFDFDRFDISKQNKIMINDFLKSSIKENSTVAITGSTDRLGELKYNYKLSSDRANSVKNYIQTINPNAKITDIVGIGPSILPYDNNIPEGRFYCRTVLIEVKTPLKK